MIKGTMYLERLPSPRIIKTSSSCIDVYECMIGFLYALSARYGLLDVARAVLSYAVDSATRYTGVYDDALLEALRGDVPFPGVDELPKWGSVRPRSALFRTRKEWRPARVADGVAVSLFTGAYGLDLGFELAGFHIAVGLDISENSMKIVKANRPSLPFILGDVSKIKPEDYLREARLKPGEPDVLVAGPPCQPFSSFGKRLGWLDARSAAIKALAKYIEYSRPRVVVVEEVPPARRELLPYLRHVAERLGYMLKSSVLNAWHYDTAQDRRRLFVVLSKMGVWSPPLPSPRRLVFAEVAPPGSEDIGWAELPESVAKFAPYIPGGGSWRVLPKKLAEEAMGKALHQRGGRTGFLRRIAWFWPAPTLVANPAHKGTTLMHPWEDRPLGVREYLLVQGFPRDWSVPLPTRRAYALVGQAVPVPLAYHVAKSIAALINGRKKGS